MNNTNKNLKFRTRILFWNKHFNNLNYQPKISETLKNIVANDFPEIKYCLFTAERGIDQSSSDWHFQGYTEFKNPATISSIDNRLTQLWNQTPWIKEPQTSFFSQAKVRQGSRQHAIDYVKKQGIFSPRKSEQIDQTYEYGFQEVVEKYNSSDPEIPSDIDGQKIALDDRLSKGYYRDFTDIKKDLRLLFVSNKKFCKNLWDEYHPIITIDAEPLQIIWVYGVSSAGKSTWTNNYIKSLNYSNFDVCCKSYEGIDKVWFNISDEGKKVLWIEEVRKDFPNNNKLIKIISKKDWLPVKGSQIKNTFEVLIINSLDAPESVYSYLEKGNQIEVLRRIYLGKESKVLHIIKTHDKNYNKVIDVTRNVPLVLRNHLLDKESKEFEPVVEKKEPNFLSRLWNKIFYKK